MTMARTRSYLLPTAGSKTAGLTADIAELGGEAERGALPSLLRGDLGAAALQLAPGVYGKTTGLTPPVTSALQKALLTPMVDKDTFIKQIQAARQATERAERNKAAAARRLAVPLVIPGAREQPVQE